MYKERPKDARRLVRSLQAAAHSGPWHIIKQQQRGLKRYLRMNNFARGLSTSPAVLIKMNAIEEYIAGMSN